MRGVKAALVVSGVLVLTACGTQAEGSTLSEAQIERLAIEAEEAGYAEQAAFLEDGEVTEREYAAAVDNYVECVAQYGYSVSERVVSPVDSLSFEYVTDTVGFDQNEASGNIQACSERHITYVERGYLGSHEARMDVPLLRAMDACVRDRGISTTGNETAPRDFFELEGMDPPTFSECLTGSAEDLYPELPSISVAF